MNFEKLKYSKCPHCKKYGISASRGIQYHYTSVEICKYCGKKYRVNWALAFLLKCLFAFIYGGFFLIINTYIIQVPLWIIGISGAFLYLIIRRICPMEEEKDK